MANIKNENSQDVELIENMPKWNPAKKDGKPIDSYYNIPVKYSLE